MGKTPVLTPYTKIHLKRIKDLNIGAKTITLLAENTGGNLCDFGLGNEFLSMIPKAQETKEQNRRIGLPQIWRRVRQRTLSRKRRQPTGWEDKHLSQHPLHASYKNTPRADHDHRSSSLLPSPSASGPFFATSSPLLSFLCSHLFLSLVLILCPGNATYISDFYKWESFQTISLENLRVKQPGYQSLRYSLPASVPLPGLWTGTHKVGLWSWKPRDPTGTRVTIYLYLLFSAGAWFLACSMSYLDKHQSGQEKITPQFQPWKQFP